MITHNNFQLQRLNTFGVQAQASKLIVVDTVAELQHLSDIFDDEWLILGGGSNMLFTQNYRGTIVKPNIQGLEIVEESTREVWVRAGAGLVWDDFVAWCVMNGYYGLENLSDIPGSVGASPVQNIGAYGVEVKDFIESVDGIALPSGTLKSFRADECGFAYRDSIFKSTLKNTFLVGSVVFRLRKTAHVETSYGNVAAELARQGAYTPQEVRNVIKRIRRTKLPFPEQLGNAGSFFKNPVVPNAFFESLKNKHDNVPGYIQPDGIKVPAAWFIEKSGLKGFSKGRVATHHLQPLVIVNLGGASGQEIADFSVMIQEKVNKQFGVMLEAEVRVV